MGMLSSKSLAGPGYIILNILRGMNIIGLLAIIAAALVMLIKTKIINSFFFFDCVGHVVTLLVCIFLIISEASLFRPFFANYWPLLSPSSGFLLLGLALFVLGATTLGNLNTDAYSEQNLGLAFWRIIVAAGILAFILGVFNVAATFVFSDTDNGVTARQVRHKGAVAVDAASSPARKYNIGYPQKAESFYTTSSSSGRGQNAQNPPPNYNTSPPRTTAPNFSKGGLPMTSQTSLVEHHNYDTEAQSARRSHRFSRFDPRNIISANLWGRDGSKTQQHAPPASSYYGDDDADRAREADADAPPVPCANPAERYKHLVPHFANVNDVDVQRPDSSYHPARQYSA